jgi:hypothetical protein
MAADECVGRRGVADVVVGSREAVEPPFVSIEENRHVHGGSRERLTEFAGCCLTTELRSLDVRGGLVDPSLCSGRRGESTEHSSLIPDATSDTSCLMPRLES